MATTYQEAYKNYRAHSFKKARIDKSGPWDNFLGGSEKWLLTSTCKISAQKDAWFFVMYMNLPCRFWVGAQQVKWLYLCKYNHVHPQLGRCTATSTQVYVHRRNVGFSATVMKGQVYIVPKIPLHLFSRSNTPVHQKSAYFHNYIAQMFLKKVYSTLWLVLQCTSTRPSQLQKPTS